MPLIFGLTGSGAAFRRLPITDEAAPVMERFVADAWRAQLSVRPPRANPGTYSLGLLVEYELEHGDVRRLFVEIVEPPSDPGVDIGLWRALRATGCLKDMPFTYSMGVRSVKLPIRLRVPDAPVVQLTTP